MYVIRIMSDALGGRTRLDGQCIKTFNPDANNGRGLITACSSKIEAKRFKTTADAHSFWMTQSTIDPVRPDGQPNRPLTAFTIEIIPV